MSPPLNIQILEHAAMNSCEWPYLVRRNAFGEKRKVKCVGEDGTIFFVTGPNDETDRVLHPSNWRIHTGPSWPMALTREDAKKEVSALLSNFLSGGAHENANREICEAIDRIQEPKLEFYRKLRGRLNEICCGPLTIWAYRDSIISKIMALEHGKDKGSN